MKYNGPKTRRARRVGIALRDKDTKYLVKRNYPPGMHGQGRRRISEFGLHHMEKQKAKWTYMLSEKQFARYVAEASKKAGMTGDLLLQLLELRLDNVVYRIGFASSRAQARQMVSHGFFTVNGEKVDIPSFHVKPGDVVAVGENKKSSKLIQNLLLTLKDAKLQEWLSLDAKNLSGKVLSLPSRDLTGSIISMDLIVEHYNR